MFSSKVDEKIYDLPMLFIAQIELPYKSWKFSIHYMPVFKGIVFYLVNHCQYKSTAILPLVLQANYSRIPTMKMIEDLIRESCIKSILMEAENDLKGQHDIRIYYANDLIAYFEKPCLTTITTSFHKVGDWQFLHDLATSLSSELESVPL